MTALKKSIRSLVYILLTAALFLVLIPVSALAIEEVPQSRISISDIPPFDGSAITVLNNNVPDFYVDEITSDPYVRFSPLDALGRTGAGMACLGKETLPTQPRGEIGDIRPSGFQTARYDDLIEDRYLFNRCHVIGYQLCGDNATPENLFTGTRYLNTDSMLLFEDKVAGYLHACPDNHVIYRVTPLYAGDDLVASGVEMEALSVEDFGTGLSFHVFVYNIQPGIAIDYATGDSWVDPTYSAGAIRGAAQVLSESAASQIQSEGTAAQDLSEGTGAQVQSEGAVAQIQAEGTGAQVLSEGTAAQSLTEGAAAGTETFVITEDTASDAGIAREIPQAEKPSAAEITQEAPLQISYILNTNTKKFHYPDCSSVQDMKEKNKEEFYGSREEAIARGFVPCGRCKP